MALITELSPSDPITRRALEGLQSTCPILRDAQFFSRPGSATRVKEAREGGGQSTIYRSINDSPNTATPPTPNYLTPAKKLISWDAKADVQLEARNEDPETELSLQTYLESQEVGWTLQNDVFNGDNAGNAEAFDGFGVIVNPSWVIPVATDGHVLQLGNSDDAVTAQQTAIRELKKAIRRVRGGATHMYMNGDLLATWLIIAKHIGYYRQSKDELGNDLDLIAGVIVRDAGLTKAGAEILPFSETTGASTNCSSIYLVRWGEGTDLSILTSNGLQARYAGQSGNFLINNMNMDWEFVLQNPTALVQSSGWRLAAA